MRTFEYSVQRRTGNRICNRCIPRYARLNRLERLEFPVESASMASLSIRIDLGPDNRIGPGKVQLLEMIAEHGSISAAGRALGMSYRRAWMLVEAMNQGFGNPVVEAQIGGKSGGGAKLSSFGADVIAHYRAVERAAEKAAAPFLSRLAAGTADRS